LPTWLAPNQITILPVNNEFHLEFSKQLLERFKKEGFRAKLDDANEKLGYRLRNAQVNKIPYSIVIGDNEKNNNLVTYRRFGEKNQITVSIDEFIALIHDLINNKK